MVGALGYRPRLVDGLLANLLAAVPAVVVSGPRATGKTTTAARQARTVVRLDRESEAAAFRADPDAALRGCPEPVLIDEWQVVPGVLGAVKRAVEAGAWPGRFLLTGSVQARPDHDGWSAIGRAVHMPMYGMTVREQLCRTDSPLLLDRLAEGEGPVLPPETPDLRDYVELALRGGYPEAALTMAPNARQLWLESYVDQILTWDALRPWDSDRLRRYAEAYALNSAGVVNDSTLYQAAGVDRRTAIAYERLLASLLLVEAVPAWSCNRLKRLVLGPKRYLVEPHELLAAGVPLGAGLRD
jgi:uncharacterized protein